MSKLLVDEKEAVIFQRENNEMIMVPVLYLANTLIFIFVVLAH